MTRRLKMFWIDYAQIMAVLEAAHRSPSCVAMPEVSGVPAGATVHHCFYDHPRMVFGVLISHESFPYVPEGERVPDGLPLTLRLVASRVYNPDTMSRMSLDELTSLRDLLNTEIYDRERR